MPGKATALYPKSFSEAQIHTLNAPSLLSQSSTLKPLHEQLLKVSEDLIKEKEINEQLRSANAALEAVSFSPRTFTLEY
jgi:hypothetical protein